MTVKEFEEAVWKVENVRVVVRAADEKEKVGDYNYQNAANESWSIADWDRKRVRKKLGAKREIIVIDGSGEVPHGGTLLRTIRRSYQHGTTAAEGSVETEPSVGSPDSADAEKQLEQLRQSLELERETVERLRRAKLEIE